MVARDVVVYSSEFLTIIPFQSGFDSQSRQEIESIGGLNPPAPTFFAFFPSILRKGIFMVGLWVFGGAKVRQYGGVERCCRNGNKADGSAKIYTSGDMIVLLINQL